MIKQGEVPMSTKKLELKHQCWDQIYVIILMHIMLWKEILLSLIQMMQQEIKALHWKIMHHLSHFKKGVQTDNAEDLDVVMLMYNLLEYSKNYRETTDSLWNYYREEPSNPLSSNSESSRYKISITGNNYNLVAGNDGYDENKVGINETKFVIPLKHLSSFWRILNIPLINSEIKLILTWPKNCFLANMIERAAESDNVTLAFVRPTGLEFQITATGLCIPVITLSKEKNKKFLALKLGFKRSVKWNKYRSQMTIKSNNNNLNYLID